MALKFPLITRTFAAIYARKFWPQKPILIVRSVMKLRVNRRLVNGAQPHGP